MMDVMQNKIIENRHGALLLIFAFAVLVRGYGLSAQPPTDDEMAAASAASNYLETGMLGQVMWYHPPLRNIVIFLSGQLFGGYSAWGLRFGSLLFGSMTVLLTGYLAYALFRDRIAAILAAFFLCIDPLHIALSREAFQETTTSFFIVAGVLAGYRAVTRDSVAACYLSGALFGIASASKWHGLFPWAVCAVAYAAYARRPAGQSPSSMAVRLLTVCSAYGIVPVLIYTAMYFPWLFRGYSFGEFVDFQLWLAQHQYSYVSEWYTEQFLPHRAYEWFLWPVAWVDFVFHQGKAYLLIAMGNYLVWVLTLPSLLITTRSWLKEKLYESGFLAALFLASYLPLVLTTRSIWVFAAPAVIPFAFVMTGRTVSRLLETGTITRKALALYLAVVIALSAVMYPMATFKTLDYPLYKPLADRYSPHR